MKNNLKNSEKFLKSCWKNKVTITLGTVILFLMTGCGSSGSGSSSPSNIVSGGGTSSSNPVVPTPQPPVSTPQPPVNGVPDEKPGIDIPEKPVVPSEPSNPGVGGDGNIEPPASNPNQPSDSTPKPVQTFKDGTEIYRQADGSFLIKSPNDNYSGVTFRKNEAGQYVFTKEETKEKITTEYTLVNSAKSKDLVFAVKAKYDKGNEKVLANGMKISTIASQVDANNKLVGDKSVTITTTDGKTLTFSDFSLNGMIIKDNNNSSITLTRAEPSEMSTTNEKFNISSTTGNFNKLEGATIDFSDKKAPVISKDGIDYTVGNGVYVGEKVLKEANGNTATWSYDADGKNSNKEFKLKDKRGNNLKFQLVSSSDTTQEFLVTEDGESNENISWVHAVNKVSYDSSNKQIKFIDLVNPNSSVTLKQYTQSGIPQNMHVYEIVNSIGDLIGKFSNAKYIVFDSITGEVTQVINKDTSSSSSNGYKEIAKNTYAKKVEGLENNDLYVITKDGKNYIYNGKLALTRSTINDTANKYVDLSAIQNAINVEQGTVNVDSVLKAIKKSTEEKIDVPTQAGTSNNNNVGQLVDNRELENTSTDVIVNKSLVNVGKININDGEKIVTENPYARKKAESVSVGQALVATGGVDAFNFGVIDVKSANGIAVGQVSDSTNLSGINGMGLYNLGLIKVEANGKKSIITNSRDGRAYTINGAGMYVQSIETPVFGYNLGTIAIDNSKNNGEYKSVGMVADGKGARVYNFGTIEVKGGLTGAVGSNINIANDNSFLMGVNGGQAFNYGTLKANGENLIVSGDINSSTKAKYISDKKVIIDDDINVLAEAGKGDSYTVEGYITAKEGVEGLDKITSNGVYSVLAVENVSEDGNKIVDLQLNKTKKLEDIATGETSQMISNLGLDQYIYGKNSGKYASVLNNMITSNGNDANILKPLFGFEYTNLNGVILNSAKDFMDNTDTVIKNKGAYISGDFNRNFEGIATFDKTGTKVGVFKKYKEKANENAGIDYTKDSIAVIASQNITNNLSLNFGYENEKDKYKGDSKLESNRGMLGFNFNYDFGQGISYNLLANGTYGKSQMTRNGVKDGKFNTYTVGMENSITKAFEVEYLNESAVTLGIRTIGFGHDKIDLKNSLNASESVKKNFNVSNAAVVKVKAGKDFNITENHKLNVTTEVKYEKELMNTDEWKDNLKFDTFSGDFVGAPVADDKAGKVTAKVQVGVEIKDGYSVGAYFKADTLGYREGGVQITYKF